MSRFASLAEFALLFDGPPVRTADGLLVKCPSHDDARQSLSLGQRAGKFLLHDFAGCATETILAAVGVEMKDLFLADGNTSSRGSGSPGRSDAGRSRPSPRPVGPRGASRPLGKKVYTHYDYRNEEGVLQYQSVRVETFDEHGVRIDKDFFRRRPTGRGGWINKLDPAGRRVLYRLDELMKAP